MADAVTTQILHDGAVRAVMKFTNVSDGTGESAVVKVDVSALSTFQGKTCTGVSITRVVAWAQGMSVNVLWDATTDVLCFPVPDGAYIDNCFDNFGGLTNNAGAGVTGDVLFTTVGHTAGDTYTVILEMLKNYA